MREQIRFLLMDLLLLICRGIDYALANGEVPLKANELPILMKQVIFTAHCGFLFIAFPFFRGLGEKEVLSYFF
jgi:hypothetical protein